MVDGTVGCPRQDATMEVVTGIPERSRRWLHLSNCSAMPGRGPAGGIAHHLRVEVGDEGPTAFAYRCSDGRYREVARVEPGQRLRLADPFLIDVDLAALMNRGRGDL